MSSYPRQLNLPKLLKNKSFFLFGPRSTGKTTLIQEQLPNAQVYDLLDSETYARLLRRPKILEEELGTESKVVVIDEIQKLPSLLDEVHRLIQKKKITFLLTGSSARKLKKGGANLLAGRAWEAQLMPLTSAEIPEFNLLKYLNRGGLPQVYDSKEPNEELESYVSTYLREEIQAESFTRNIQGFAEFLDLAALSNGEEINFERMSSDCQVSPSTLKNYFQILDDTLIGFQLKGFTKTKKRKAISRAKHFYFDIGVTNNLCKRGQIQAKSELFGKAFEHFIVLEARAYNSYFRKQMELTYWRSTSKMEVDLIIGGKIAIEIKSTDLVQDKHLRGLRALMEEKMMSRYLVVSLDPRPRKTEDGIEIFGWKAFLADLWSGKLF